MPPLQEVNCSWNRNDQVVFDTLYFGVQYVCGMDVDGDIIEFGTMSGNTAVALAQGLADCRRMYRSVKRLWLVDSFQGLPVADAAADLASPHVSKGVWAPGTAVLLDAEQLAARMATWLPRDAFTTVSGWFRDIDYRGEFGDAVFSCVHVDCDLYQSTIDALDRLFSQRRVSEGAIILFDDWNCNRSSREFGERKAWAELCEKYRIDCSDEGAYAVVGHKFIVHKYT